MMWQYTKTPYYGDLDRTQQLAAIEKLQQRRQEAAAAKPKTRRKATRVVDSPLVRDIKKAARGKDAQNFRDLMAWAEKLG